MIAPLLMRLAGGADMRQVRQFLDDGLAGHFGMSHGDVETGPVAARLVAWWRST